MLTVLLLAMTAWVPDPPDCSSGVILRQAYVERVRHRKPGEKVYAPIPFPQTDDEVVTDFKYAVDHDQRDDDEPEVVQGIRADRYRYEILRVTSWRRSYCVEERNPVILLRIFERSGVEVTRVTMDETGLLSYCCIRRSALLFPIPTIAEADHVLERAHIHAVDAEYVFIHRPWAESRDTPPHAYVAYRNDGGVYVVADDGLWFLSKTGKRISYVTAMKPAQLRDVLQTMPRNAHPFSIARDEYVIAVPVDTP